VSYNHKRVQPSPEQRRNDAIHRALLTGLLGNIGEKTDTHEYIGARGKKFSIFPGSSQFTVKPAWVIAAELVETTKLYARTVAPIKPEWVERAARHLVKRTYTDARWSRITGQVVAHEKVTLGGLTLVPRRTVPYAPIDPRHARELFIHHALVLGDYDTDAPYFRHNARLLREIELIEAKLRARDVLVDLKTRFAFYDARIPAAVTDAKQFEQWRREAETHDRRVLFMQKQDLLLRDPAEATPEAFPDQLTVRGIAVPLEYRYEPGHEADGVTAVVRLGMLEQLPSQPFDWLVPGYLREKVIALIRTMPKPLRVNFVPAPEFAQRAVATMRFGEGDLPHALAWQLGKLAGMQIRHDAFRPAEIEPWLRMNFRVLDDAGKVVIEGRDLDEIRRRLRIELKSAFSHLPPGEWNRDGIRRWDFGDLPERVEVDAGGYRIEGHPAIVDMGDRVALRVVESPDEARRLTRGGVRRLFIIEYSPTIQYELSDLPNLQQMVLHYAPLGTGKQLKDEITVIAADRIFLEGVQDIRTQLDFEMRLETSWNRLRPVALETAGLIGQILDLFHRLKLELSADFPPALLPAVRDMREHLATLVPKDFLTATPWEWLQHFPRYLKAIETRLKKLRNAGLLRDQQAQAVIAPLRQQYQQRLAKRRKEGRRDPELEHYRWMLEEFRVSLFAQELRTAIPVSEQRLEKQWEKVEP
jgi:ATP-dependent helicase HrpA